MGPRSSERGAEGRQNERASMGPRSSERGNNVRIVSVTLNEDASMGPRSSERGNNHAVASNVQFQPCFNGAALV